MKTHYTDRLVIVSDTGTSIPLDVELANTPEKRTIGLMFRKEMPEDSGMLFIFDDESVRSFWMRNTLIPLDMIFADRAGRIVHVHENARPYDETPISSKHPASQVLEINGGQAARLGIKPGDLIQFEKPAKSLADRPAIH